MLSVMIVMTLTIASKFILPIYSKMIYNGVVLFGFGAFVLGLQRPLSEEPAQPQAPEGPAGAVETQLIVPASPGALNPVRPGGMGGTMKQALIAAAALAAAVAFFFIRGKTPAAGQPPKAAPAAVDTKLLACQGGDQEACSAVGREMMEGNGRPADVDTGRRLLRSACFGGSNSACHHLAYLHMSGANYCPKDHVEGVKLYQKACDAGYGISCYNLAFAYANGEGVEKDMSGSKELMEDACDKKYQPACDLLAGGRR